MPMKEMKKSLRLILDNEGFYVRIPKPGCSGHDLLFMFRKNATGDRD